MTYNYIKFVHIVYFVKLTVYIFSSKFHMTSITVNSLSTLTQMTQINMFIITDSNGGNRNSDKGHS